VDTKTNAACAQRCQVVSITPCAHSDKCQMPTKMSAGHQIVMCPGKSTLGAHQDAKCPPKCHMPTKRKAGSLPNVGALQNTCWVPSKMPGGTQNAGCPTKIHWVHMNVLGAQLNVTCPPEETLGAHTDATWPRKSHVST